MLTHWSQLVPNSVNRNPRTLSNTTAAAAAAAAERRSCVKVKMAVPNSPHGLCGRKATLNLNLTATSTFTKLLNSDVTVLMTADSRYLECEFKDG